MEKRTEDIMIKDLVTRAVNGDSEALEALLAEVNDFIFNLSLRMLGTIADAQDASQEILIKVMTSLSSFRQKSSFKTWVYRIASNYLVDYKKNMFSQYPLDFSYYANDLRVEGITQMEDPFETEERKLMAEELKLSCTNVMLQCLTPLNRCVFILGTMFGLDSRTAGELLGISSESYRQRLSRSRKRMRDFLGENCGLAGGFCRCQRRIDYAIDHSRLDPDNLEYSALKPLERDLLEEYRDIMENMEDLAGIFEGLPIYHSAIDSRDFLESLLSSHDMKKILHKRRG